MKEGKYYKYMRVRRKQIEEMIRLFGRAVKTFKQVRQEAEKWENVLALDWAPHTEGIPDELPPSLRDQEEGFLVWRPLRACLNIPSLT